MDCLLSLLLSGEPFARVASRGALSTDKPLKFYALAAALLLPLPLAGMVRGQEAIPDAPPPEASSPNAKFVTKLAGLVLFVANSCPEKTIDYDRFKSVVTGLGVEVDALSKDPIKLASLNYFTSYGANVKDNCTRALTEFGPDGRIVRGIFSEK